MNLKELSERIDKSPQNESFVDLDALGEELGLDLWGLDAATHALSCYWAGSWLCTDTDVGYRMYFFNDKPVAFSIQEGRKSKEAFKWFSRTCAKEVKDYLLTLLHDNGLSISIWDINTEIGETYTLNYTSQLLQHKTIFCGGERVELLECMNKGPYRQDTKVKIRFLNGAEKVVDINLLDFGFNVK